MKTPRDILLGQHRAALPQLDAVRREVVAGLNHEGTKAQSESGSLVSWCLGGLNRCWTELFWPCRRIWAGMAAVWIGLALFNAHLAEPRGVTAMAEAKTAPAGAAMTLREKSQLLAELTRPLGQPLSEPPRPPVNQPRSDRRRFLSVG